PSCYLTQEEIAEPVVRNFSSPATKTDSTLAVLDKPDTSTSVNSETYTVVSRVTSPPLELTAHKNCFAPNPTTVRFSRAVKINPRELVFDIGTGIGPLAIMAGKMGAGRVIAV